MAYKKKELEAQALEAIKKHKLVFINEVVSYLPCDSATFYRHECEKCETIKEALELNKVQKKVKLRNNWEGSQNATLQLALYKLIGTDEEAHRLNGTKRETQITGKDGEDLFKGFSFLPDYDKTSD